MTRDFSGYGENEISLAANSCGNFDGRYGIIADQQIALYKMYDDSLVSAFSIEDDGGPAASDHQGPRSGRLDLQLQWMEERKDPDAYCLSRCGQGEYSEEQTAERCIPEDHGCPASRAWSIWAAVDAVVAPVTPWTRERRTMRGSSTGNRTTVKPSAVARGVCVHCAVPVLARAAPAGSASDTARAVPTFADCRMPEKISELVRVAVPRASLA